MSDCIFCKIIQGEIPSATLYEDDTYKVILDRFPGNEGHALIMPKKHIANLFELDEETAAGLFRLAVKVGKAQKEALGLTDLNLVQNNGPIAGQTVNHFHLHLIPRHEGDSVTVAWKQLDLTDEQIAAMQEKLKQAL